MNSKVIGKGIGLTTVVQKYKKGSPQETAKKKMTAMRKTKCTHKHSCSKKKKKHALTQMRRKQQLMSKFLFLFGSGLKNNVKYFLLPIFYIA